MQIVQVFIGRQFYPQGGAEDLQLTLFNQTVPSEQELCELFWQFVVKDTVVPDSCWDSYWLNMCVIGEDQVARIERWTAYANNGLPQEQAPYVTAELLAEGVRYRLVALEKRVDPDNPECHRIGPKGHPDVTFFYD